MLRHIAVVLSTTLFIFTGCGTSSNGTNLLPGTGGGGGSGGSSKVDGGGGSGGSSKVDGGGGSGGSSKVDAGGGTGGGTGGTGNGGGGTGGGTGGTGGGTGGGGTGTGTISCSTPSTSYAKNGGSCGKWRWGVKTGTDHDVGKVNMKPVVTTIQALRSLKTPSVNYCYRAPAELKTYELRNVSLRFEHLESDSDYHLVAKDAAGNTMIVEVPYPGCVGQNSCQSGKPWLCEITHARAAVDKKNPGAQGLTQLGIGSVVGAGFFDTYELGNTYPPTGMAPNGIELHPVLGICFGTNCNPLKG